MTGTDADQNHIDLTSHSDFGIGARNDAECDFRLVCDESLAGTFVVQNGCIVYANRAIAHLLGLEPDAIIGQSLLSFIHKNDREDAEKQSHRSFNGQSNTCRFETRVVKTDGDVAHVEVLDSQLNRGEIPTQVVAMIDITLRKQTALELADRLRFEQLLANLSASFVNLPCEEIDQHIDVSLKSIVEFLGNDRSTLVEFGDDDNYVNITHSFASPGCETFPIGSFATAQLPWFINEFRSGNFVFIRDIPDDLPDDALHERDYCRKWGIQSNLTVPLKAGGVLLGGLTFAFLQKRCEWSSEVITRLQLLGEVLANALLRRRNSMALLEAAAENEKLRQRLEQENLFLREQVILKHHHGRIIGVSDGIMRVLAESERVGPTAAPVLLMGETGTGKELVAQTIHELSDRKNRPMVVVNCASLPASLVECELFGRTEGDSPGAALDQVGRFELADGSTLFLDEIGEFPLELQAKLLRVLEDGRFQRLGSSQTISVDVRIIAATNRDLDSAARAGTFRADLFHRLNVFPIHIPPLRERREDIPALAWSIVEVLGRRMGKTITNIPRKTMQQLQRYDWPGNVRELSNVIERAMILIKGDVLHAELPLNMRIGTESKMTLKEHEHEQILRVLKQTGWRIRGIGGAAELLSIKPTTLEARMRKLGIRRPSKEVFPSQGTDRPSRGD